LGHEEKLVLSEKLVKKALAKLMAEKSQVK
jgi:hypothetical protein